MKVVDWHVSTVPEASFTNISKPALAQQPSDPFSQMPAKQYCKYGFKPVTEKVFEIFVEGLVELLLNLATTVPPKGEFKMVPIVGVNKIGVETKENPVLPGTHVFVLVQLRALRLLTVQPATAFALV